MHRDQTCLILKLRRNPVHIMIVHKAVQLHSTVNSAIFIKLPPDRVGNLKVIVIVVPRIQTFVQFIVGDTVKHLLSILDITAVISMDHFSHQPEVFFFSSGSGAHLLHEAEIQTVRAVQADAVNIKFIDPEIDHIQQIIPDFLILEIQVYQFKTIPPCLVGKSVIVTGISSKPDSLVPSAVTGTFSLFLNIPESKKLSSRMIEHAVHNDLYTQFMGTGNEFPEIFVVSKPPVHCPVIPGIVSMGGGLEQRSDINRSKSQIRRMLQPFGQNIKPMGHFLLFISCGRAAKSDWVNMIKFRCLIPWCHLFKTSCC